MRISDWSSDVCSSDLWTDAALAASAGELNVPVERARLAFAGGAADMIQAWIAAADDEMAAALKAQDVASMKVRDSLRAAIWTRFPQAATYREAVRRAVAIPAMPHTAALAARPLWRPADSIWRDAGAQADAYTHLPKPANPRHLYSSPSPYHP